VSRPQGSAYGAGAPTYESAELQRSALTGRLKVAVGIRDRARTSGNTERAERWAVIVDELLDRLGEVQGR
jgi:hypothetical protein